MSRSPFVVDVVRVRQAPGVRHPVKITAPLAGVRLPVAEVPEHADVDVRLVLESQAGAVVAEGGVRVPWTGQCRRCLGPAAGELELDIREVYSTEPVEGETYPLPGERLDLAPMLREVVTLALPLAPLCRQSCPGPDPDQHPVEVARDPDAPRRRPDDTWAVLDQLRLD